MELSEIVKVKNVRLSEDGTSVVILDQTQLPNRVEYLSLRTAEDIYDAIFQLKVRGAPAIGICAGYGAYVLAGQITAVSFDDFMSELARSCAYLASSRPTAVNLSWALERMQSAARKHGRLDGLIECLLNECRAIHNEDIQMCRAISEYGLTLVRDGDGILTHCNAGPLATSEYGTGLGTLFLGHERGMTFHVYSDETRPLLQGARLTAYELHSAGIDVTLICDNMASIVMKQGRINACFVGCDRVAMNGDVANKIGTSGVAVLAKYYGIPFYVFAPSSTIDGSCGTGGDIRIELRPSEEIGEKFFVEPMAPRGVKCYNPAFDVTDSSLITAIVTEKGIIYPPFDGLRELVKT